MTTGKPKLGERLVDAGLITGKQLAEALDAQRSTGELLGTLLVRLGHISEEDLIRVLCEDADIPFTSLEGTTPEAEAIAIVPESLARANAVLPLALEDGTLVVALADPLDVLSVMALEQSTGRRATVVGAPRNEIVAKLNLAYTGDRRRSPDRPSPDPATVAASAREEAVDPGGTAAQIAEEIFQRAVGLRATDIHIEPLEDRVGVRFRLDGILRDGPTVDKSLQGALLTRVKVMAGLNIAENRLPQDGRLRIQVKGREVDLRISTFPTLHGEDMVLRILDRNAVDLRLERLGMRPDDVRLIRRLLRRPHGLVLLTGPTGSGKTTTLYSALAEMNTGERAILTLEDPVEYELKGIRQSQINVRAGLTFASGLRSLLRHDPDIILVGEMRDAETVQIGMSAAMTGHLVLTTLHTNTAAGAIPRLLDLGAEPFMLASTLHVSIAQRLVRVLCPQCCVPYEVPPAVRRKFGLEGVQLYSPKGCGECHGTGYRGRLGLFEVLPVDEKVSECIYEQASAERIRRTSGRPTLFAAGLEKVRDGVTSLEELVRVVTVT